MKSLLRDPGRASSAGAVLLSGCGGAPTPVNAAEVPAATEAKPSAAQAPARHGEPRPPAPPPARAATAPAATLARPRLAAATSRAAAADDRRARRRACRPRPRPPRRRRAPRRPTPTARAAPAPAVEFDRWARRPEATMEPRCPAGRDGGRGPALQGVGLGLRRENLDELLELLDADDPRLGGDRLLRGLPRELHAPRRLHARRGRPRARAVPPRHARPDDVARRGRPLRRRLLRRAAPLPRRAPGTPFHSDHLSFSGAGGRILHDLLPLPLSRASARHAARARPRGARRLELPFALENITHYLVPGEPSIDEADFIADVLEDERRGAAARREQRLRQRAELRLRRRIAFLERLPLGRVVEIHVAGHERFDEDELLDRHPRRARRRSGARPAGLGGGAHRARPGRCSSAITTCRRCGELLGRARRVIERRLPAGACSRGAVPPRRPAMQPEPSGTGRCSATMTRLVRAPEAPAALAEDAQGWLAAGGLDAEDAAQLAAFGPNRLLVYRRHVRRALMRAVRQEIPRTAARLGEAFARLGGPLARRGGAALALLPRRGLRARGLGRAALGRAIASVPVVPRRSRPGTSSPTSRSPARRTRRRVPSAGRSRSIAAVRFSAPRRGSAATSTRCTGSTPRSTRATCPRGSPRRSSPTATRTTRCASWS